MKKILLCLITALGIPSLTYAIDELTAVSRMAQTVEPLIYHAVAGSTLYANGGAYHPVLGIVFEPRTSNVIYDRVFAVDQPEFLGFADWDYKGPDAVRKLKVQVAPVLTDLAPQGTPDDRFVSIESLTAPQLAEALWLWRLTNPNKKLRDFTHTQALYNQANILCYLAAQNQNLSEVHDPARVKAIVDAKSNLASIKLTGWLIDPNFKPQGYAELAQTTTVYPKHVTLTKDGFPTPAPEAAQAELLDTLLMLSNPVEMAEYNNTLKEPQAFKLTPQEEEGAKQLLALRKQTYSLSSESSPREVLEEVYNRLSSLLVDYKTPGLVNHKQLYWAYPDSDIYLVVRNTIKGQQPVVVQQNGISMLANPEVTHLIVLNALMEHNSEDISKNDWYAMLVVNAFKYLCAQFSQNPQNMPHLQMMLNALHYRLGNRIFSYEHSGGKWLKPVDDFVGSIPTSSRDQEDFIRSFTF